ncbi:alpha/beta fold hydrolase [Hydrogenophaga sp.]|uniref:alpha/beta fold hydrolase n=1 Tax=Hydrogenophaga sp. TaxID=1904254 RepID=UPI00272BC727|nr:alpha/beta hydrolase [Hydrogenophaga sp.]
MPYLDIASDFRPYYEIHDATDPWEASETIFFIHGFAESSQAYYGWLPNLSRRFRLVTYDLRGLGRNKPVDASFEYSSDLMAKDAAHVMEKLANGPCHVVAAKSGSIIASRLAVNRPDLVKSLILACPVGAPTNDDWVGHIEQHGVRSYARWTMPSRLGLGASDAMLDWWSDLMGKTAPSTAYAYFRWVTKTQPIEDLKKIDCPILAIMTTPPPEIDIGSGQLTATNFKLAASQAQVVVIPHDCYHISAVQPDACAREALAFIASLSQPLKT